MYFRGIKHGSLFSGIGGFDLAAQWMGWENIFHCEWNEFGQKVLKHYWPEAISYHDITKTDFTIHRGTIDILTGGFPCQPYSMAGKRKGKEDERHLWPEMLRAILEIQPTWVVGENVSGLVNWSNGLVFDEVQTDLETEGFEVIPFILPACAVNAPHRRDRVWFVAYSRCNGIRKRSGKGICKKWEKPINENFDNFSIKSTTTNSENTNCCGCLHGESEKGESEKRGFGNTCTGDNERICGETGVVTDTKCKRPSGKEYRKAESGINTENDTGIGWANFPTVSPICQRDDEFSAKLSGITFSKWRNESIKALGNAVVPALVLQIFKTIQDFETP